MWGSPLEGREGRRRGARKKNKAVQTPRSRNGVSTFLFLLLYYFFRRSQSLVFLSCRETREVKRE